MNQWLAPHNLLLANPEMLLLLLLIPLALWVQHKRKKKQRASVMGVSTTEGIKQLKVSWKVRWMPLMNVLRVLAFALLVIAMARPQRTDVSENIDSEGIDIVLSVDISGSMLAEDFKPNRIEAAKATALHFIDGRPTDRIGLVIFSGESFTQCPITIDHQVLKTQLAAIKSGMLEDGTAIGMGLATAVDRLRNAPGESRVVILMTDGINNTGLVDPQTALEIAKAYGVRVYTIGVGSQGEAMYPVQTPFGIQKQMQPVQIDERLLQQIAEETGGKYYRATGNAKLDEIYKEIDELEKTKVSVSAYKRYDELFFPFTFAAVAALLLEILLRYTVFRRIP